MSDNQLIAQIRSGDETVLSETYQVHRAEFIRWAEKIFRCSTEDAKEAYQVAFFIFYDNILTGKLTHISSSVKTYLFAVGKNKLLEQQRHTARHFYEVRDEMLSQDEPGDDMTASGEAKYRQMEEGLQQLGQPCRQILEMVYYESRSMDYITEKLGYKNAGTTKNQKYKCMQRLKKIVEMMQVG